MNFVPLWIFKLLWPWAVVSVLWVGSASLQRIDRVRLTTEPSLCVRAGLPVQGGWCVMDANMSWRFPSGKRVVRPLEAGGPGQRLILTSSEEGSLSYGYNPDNFHSAGGMPAIYGLIILALGIASLPFLNDIRSVFRQLPGRWNSDAVFRRR